MPSQSSHEFLEHTGEVRIRIRAATWPALLAEAGRGLADLALRSPSGGAPGEWRAIAVDGPDREALLVNWLNELIYQAETSSSVPNEFEISAASETRLAGSWRGIAVAQPPALVKAATLHGVRVEPAGGGWEAEVVLDI